MPEFMHLTYTYDGDTLGARRTLGSLSGQEHLRLAYIDAPEIAQSPWGIRARSYLRTLLVVNERIQVDIKSRDKYGRLIAEVLRTRDYGNLGLRMVLQGYAALFMCPSKPIRPTLSPRALPAQEGRDLVAVGSPSNALGYSDEPTLRRPGRIPGTGARDSGLSHRQRSAPPHHPPRIARRAA
jgi:hypothetical protein